MPYIPIEDRVELQNADRIPDNCGELNFQITNLFDEYIAKHGLKYQTINDILGAVNGAEREFYARIARPYEDLKAHANGDVYSHSMEQLERLQASSGTRFNGERLAPVADPMHRGICTCISDLLNRRTTDPECPVHAANQD